MTFYSMTTDVGDAFPSITMFNSVVTKMIENGWVDMGSLFDYPVTLTGTATNGDGSSLFDTSKNWTVNEHVNKLVTITGGQGVSPSKRLIISNTANKLVVSNWASASPNSGSTYTIETSHNRVLKSVAGTNGLPGDFYVTLTSGLGTALHFALHETFDTQTKTRDKFAPYNPSGTSSGLAVNSDYSLVTTKTNTLANLYAYMGSVSLPTTSSTPLRLIVDASHLIFARTNGLAYSTNNAIYVGAFDSFLSAIRDPMPLILSSLYSGSSTYNNAASSRDPGITFVNQYNGCYSVSMGMSVSSHFTYMAAANSLVAYGNVDAGTNPWTGVANAGTAQRILLRSARNFYFSRGIYRDLLTTASGLLPGQTMDVNFGATTKRFVLVSSGGSGSPYFGNYWIPDEA